MLGDLGGALSVPLVRIGDRLGLYQALHTEGPMTPAELAASRIDAQLPLAQLHEPLTFGRLRAPPPASPDATMTP